MAGVPNRLQPTTPLSDNLALINDNFDKLVSNIAGLGAKTANSPATGSVTLAAGGTAALGVAITDPGNAYVNGIAEVCPRLEVFVDTDNTDTLTWPFGTSLTSGQANAVIGVHQNRRATSGAVGTLIIYFHNFDVGAHTYYYHLDVQYLPQPFTPTTTTGGGFAS